MPRRSHRKRAVFLDRDGVVTRCEMRNGKPYALRSLKGFRLLPGVRAAITKLKRAGLDYWPYPLNIQFIYFSLNLLSLLHIF